MIFMAGFVEIKMELMRTKKDQDQLGERLITPSVVSREALIRWKYANDNDDANITKDADGEDDIRTAAVMIRHYYPGRL